MSEIKIGSKWHKIYIFKRFFIVIGRIKKPTKQINPINK